MSGFDTSGPAVTRRVCLASLLSLVGCAAPAIVFDRTNFARIKRMGVLTPGFPDKPNVAVLPPTNGALFLLVGGIQEGNRSREFADFVASAGATPEHDFTAALMAGLSKAGIQPSPVPADPRRTDLRKEYGTIAAPDVDALLDVVVTRYGYYAVTNAAPFKPTVVMQARVIDARSRIVLMEDHINMVDIAPAGADGVSYQDYADLARDPTGAVKGVVSAMGMAAASVCQRLT